MCVCVCVLTCVGSISWAWLLNNNPGPLHNDVIINRYFTERIKQKWHIKVGNCPNCNHRYPVGAVSAWSVHSVN